MITMEELLALMVRQGGSDLHISVHSPPRIRLDGALLPVDHAPLTPDETRRLATSVLTSDQIARLDRDLELDCSFGLEGYGRFRVNVFYQRGSVACVLRLIPFEILGFDGIAQNSLDAVSDRDFAIEFCHTASLLMMHLSRWSEELVLWSSPLLGFIDLPDRFCTGSSIMPQKKNPDVPELVRGKTGRVYGALISLLTLMKSQPLAYNKDNQEDKEPLFDTVKTLQDCLRAFVDMLPHIEPNRTVMRNAALKGFATATDLADYLVRQDVPFRDAHHIVGKLVGIAIERQVDLADLDLPTMQAVSDKIGDDVYECLTLEGSVNARNHLGGTAPAEVASAVARARSGD